MSSHKCTSCTSGKEYMADFETFCPNGSNGIYYHEHELTSQT